MIRFNKWLAVMLAVSMMFSASVPAYAGSDDSNAAVQTDSKGNVENADASEAEPEETAAPETEPETAEEPETEEAEKTAEVEETEKVKETAAVKETTQASETAGAGTESGSAEKKDTQSDKKAKDKKTKQNEDGALIADDEDAIATDESTEEDGIEDYSDLVADSSDEGAKNQRIHVTTVEMEVPPFSESNGGFVTVDQVPALAKELLKIREDMSDKADEVGTLVQNGVCYVLEEPLAEDGSESGWLYVESGSVRGFVRKSEVILYEDMTKKQKKKAKTAPAAIRCKSFDENTAYAYSQKTTKQTLVSKVYALADRDIKVRSSMNKKGEVVGTLKKNGLCYILKRVDDDWAYIMSGEVRGFVKVSHLKTGDAVTGKVLKKGEENYSTAEASVEAAENKAYYYTMTSVVPGTLDDEITVDMLENLNDYVNTAEVPGALRKGKISMGRLVETFYSAYGYETGDTAESIQNAGRSVKSADIQTGDIVVYQTKIKKKTKTALGIYLEDGKVLCLNNKSTKTTTKKLAKLDVQKIVRIVPESQTQIVGAGVGDVNADSSMYGKNLGVFKLTFYCPCSECCGPFTDGITSTGRTAVEGRTIAVDPTIIPYGTKVIIGGHVFVAEDCGGAIKGNRIDVYVDNHAVCNALGVQYANVFLCK